MDQRLSQAIRTRASLRDLAQLEDNIRRQGQLTEDVRAALDERSGELARGVVAERTGLDLRNLSAAEEKIVRATAKYVGIKIRSGTNANRTLMQIRSHGLIGAAEAAVSRATTTLGFQTLTDEGLSELSYEQIVVDHPEEFSERAVWYARRTLGLPNASNRPPSHAEPRMSGQTPPGAPQTQANSDAEAPYWVFVCNPKKWAIDRFLQSRIDLGTWGVRPSDADRFAPGQLGIVRVGVDRRTEAERGGRPPLEPGIYAICEVESAMFPGTGEADAFWAADEAPKPGWPTVRIRYLKTFLTEPLTIVRLRNVAPELSPLLLNGLQASSFPIAPADFRKAAELLGASVDQLPAPDGPPPSTARAVAAMEKRYLQASPEVKERMSRFIERGPVGAWAKAATGHKCQLCAALGMQSIGFRKRDGEPYVEAHHVMPVSHGEVGSLALSNIMTVCANHHRQLHYGNVTVAIGDRQFEIDIDERHVTIDRLGKLAC